MNRRALSFMQASFRGRVFWSLVPVLLALFVFIGVVDFYRQSQLAQDEIEKRAKSMAENLAYTVRLAVLTEDKWLLDAALQSAMGAADFAYVFIYGEKSTPLSHAHGKNMDMRDLTVDLTVDQRQQLTEIKRSHRTRSDQGELKYVEYLAPVISTTTTIPYELQLEPTNPNVAAQSQMQQTIGAVRIGLTTARVKEQMASFLKWRGWSLAVFLCFSTLAIYIIFGRITRPINRLTEQAKKMSRGYLNEAIPVDSRDEIGQLAIAFNEMARALNEQYIVLEQKVAERTKELRVVNLKLAEASDHKSRFLANVNHELRTPLSSIIGYARLLRRETAGQITSLQRDNLDDLLRNAERLLGLIESLLDIARIEAGKLEIHVEPVEIDELIHRAAAAIEPMLDEESVRLVRDVPANMGSVYTDPEILRQIIFNLLGNAVKFTDRGEIRVSACRENGHIKLAVADTGIGIEKADFERIFEEFDRGRLSSAGGYRGTGLGLAIVKSLVNVLGGSVAVESEVGKGSTFTVTLPVDHGSSSVRSQTGMHL